MDLFILYFLTKSDFSTLKVIGELYRPGGGAYNVDGVLSIMVRGLEEELRDRLAGGSRYVANSNNPSPQYENNQDTAEEKELSVDEQKVLSQGASGKDLLRTARKVVKWAKRRNKEPRN